MREDILVQLVQYYDSGMSEAIEKEENKELRKKLSAFFIDMIDSNLKGQVSNQDKSNKLKKNVKKNYSFCFDSAFFLEEYAEDLLPIVTKIHNTLNKFPTIGLKTNIKDCSEPLFFTDKNHFELKLIFTEFKTKKTSNFNFYINIKDSHVHTNYLQQHINKFIESSFTYFQRELISKLQKKAKKPKKVEQKAKWNTYPNIEVDGVSKLSKPKDIYAHNHEALSATPNIKDVEDIKVLNETPHYLKIRRLIARIMEGERSKKPICKLEEKENTYDVTINRKEFFQALDCNKENERKILEYLWGNRLGVDLQTGDSFYTTEILFGITIKSDKDKRIKNLNSVTSTKKIKSFNFKINKTVYRCIENLKSKDDWGFTYIIDNVDKVIESVFYLDKNLKKIKEYSEEIKNNLSIKNKKATTLKYKNSMSIMAEYINSKVHRIPKNQLFQIDISVKEYAQKNYKGYIDKNGKIHKSLIKYYILMDIYVVKLAHETQNLEYVNEFKEVTYTTEKIHILVETKPKKEKTMQSKMPSGKNIILTEK